MGLQASQLAVVGAACVAGVAAMRADPDPAGLVVAAMLMVAGLAAACVTVAGRSATSWAPVVSAWAWRRLGQPAISPIPGAGQHLTTGPSPGSAATRPGTQVDSTSRRRRPSPGPARLGVTVLAPAGAEARPAVIHDRRAGTYAAVVSVRGGSFPLLDCDDKQQRLSAWGAALAAMGREGSPVHRLQWIERTVAGGSERLLHHLDEAGSGTGAACHSYRQLVSGAGPTTQLHEVLLVLAVRGRGGAARPRARAGRDGAVRLLHRELHLLEGQLAAADLTVERAFDEADLALLLAAAVTPGTPGDRARSGPLGAAWPLATDDRWGTFRTDGSWHATYWVAEWPRLDVGPDFLSPLLLTPGVRRTVAVTMAPVGPARAARQVEAARTADMADEQLRRRAGFVTTARRQREAEGVVRRSTELADGHAEYRFAGYVTVSAPDRDALDAGCAEVEQSASQSHLELRRLYGQQEEAFTWTLPLARGVA
jgi:hypothetical protein